MYDDQRDHAEESAVARDLAAEYGPDVTAEAAAVAMVEAGAGAARAAVTEAGADIAALAALDQPAGVGDDEIMAAFRQVRDRTTDPGRLFGATVTAGAVLDDQTAARVAPCDDPDCSVCVAFRRATQAAQDAQDGPTPADAGAGLGAAWYTPDGRLWGVLDLDGDGRPHWVAIDLAVQPHTRAEVERHHGKARPFVQLDPETARREAAQARQRDAMVAAGMPADLADIAARAFAVIGPALDDIAARGPASAEELADGLGRRLAAAGFPGIDIQVEAEKPRTHVRGPVDGVRTAMPWETRAGGPR